MLVTATDTPAKIWQNLLHELHRGALDPKHPFRYLTLATSGGQFPEVRTVVLRQLTVDFQFLVFTDFRSSKVQELATTPQVSLLFYHPRKQLQVRIKALAAVHSQDELADSLWAPISEKRRTEYQSKLSPATRILTPREGWVISEDRSFFSVIKFSPQSIDVLQLSREGHLRLQYDLDSKWEGTWLVP